MMTLQDIQRKLGCNLSMAAKIQVTLAEQPVISSIELLAIARDDAEKWPIGTNNHDPSFRKAMSEAYVSGFQRGFRAAEIKQRTAP